jgi:hypothetical protein
VIFLLLNLLDIFTPIRNIAVCIHAALPFVFTQHCRLYSRNIAICIYLVQQPKLSSWRLSGWNLKSSGAFRKLNNEINDFRACF